MGLLYFSSVLLNSFKLEDGINGLLQTDKKPLNDFAKAFVCAKDQRYDSAPLPGGSYNTVEEALQAAVEKTADPNRKPISRFFGKHKGIFGGDGVAYQRAIRDEWD
jgi:hypothetical protein